MADLKAITSYIHENIEITAHLGAEVIAYDGNQVTISAPLTPNLNHRNTAFGGSISALGILSGWTLLNLRLKKLGHKTRLVIQKSTLDFLAPVEGDFEAVCSMPKSAQWERFIKTLKKYGRARITVKSEITSSSGTGGLHEGIYVAVVLKDGGSL